MMAGGLLTMMGADFPTADEIRALASRHADVLEQLGDLLTVIARQPGGQDPDTQGYPASLQIAVAGATQLLAVTTIPIGRRFMLRRVLTTAPAAGGALAIYANSSGTQDGTSLRHVIANPALASSDIIGGTLIRGGDTIVAALANAQVGLLTVRLEGQLMDDGPRTSRAL